MNHDIENHYRRIDQINTYINIVSQAYDNNIRRHLNNNDGDTLRQTIQWIKSMLTELNLTSIYDARTVVTRDEEREMVVSLLDCITDLYSPYHNYARDIMRMQHMNRNKIEFINGISNMILAEEEINDMTDSDLSDITNEELAEALMEELVED